MIDKSEAESMIRAWLAQRPLDNDEFIVCRVDEYEWGWMFFYDSKKYVDTEELRSAIAGNVPVYITRDGSFHGPVAGSGIPSAEHLRLFEAKLKAKR